ncbi:MAG: hypothetical protein LBD08_01450 [Treponema sp.]|jgi:hypothetical protein|nr:hypothetical protein [Treponema sp.]
MGKGKNRIPWHTVLLAALQLEFEDYLDILDFKAEYRLTSEPLRIDVLIIRKDTETVIASPLASIFRTINIFEYKSPADKLTADRFYKGLVYVLMYKLLNSRKPEKVDMSGISLSFAVKECPQTVMREILNTWRCTVRDPRRKSSSSMAGGYEASLPRHATPFRVPYDPEPCRLSRNSRRIFHCWAVIAHGFVWRNSPAPIGGDIDIQNMV